MQDENGQEDEQVKGTRSIRCTGEIWERGIRWYFYINSRRGCQTVSTEKQVQKDSVSSWELCRNTYAFFVLYANIDEFDATKYTLDYEKLYAIWTNGFCQNSTLRLKKVDERSANYRIPEGCKSIAGFRR